MNTRKISQLAGWELDFAVGHVLRLKPEVEADAGGVPVVYVIDWLSGKRRKFNPSEDWADAGWILEANRVTLQANPFSPLWTATLDKADHQDDQAKVALLQTVVQAYTPGETVTIPIV